jgi:hypothetical protein
VEGAGPVRQRYRFTSAVITKSNLMANEQQIIIMLTSLTFSPAELMSSTLLVGLLMSES